MEQNKIRSNGKTKETSLSLRKDMDMWYENGLIYQIYPLGAFGAPAQNDGKLAHRILQLEGWLDHLEDLGVTAILFNPLFESSRHGYDTKDPGKVDVRLGDNEDLKEISQKIHDRDMKLMLDAVFNHVGREFGPFVDVLKNRENSPYKDWFNVNFYGNNSYNDGLWYEGWEGHEELVKLNLKNPEVARYLLDTVDFWIDEFDVDGLRLDVAYLLDRDFLKNLKAHVKSRKPDFFLIGEMIGGDYNQICKPEMADSVTNYEAYKGIYSSLNSHNFFEILYSLNRQFGKENWCLYTGKPLLSFLDNHDVTRLASILENEKHLPIAYAILFTMPGIPAIYYGSEWGIKGEKSQGDAALRPAIKEPKENELTKWISDLAAIRKEHTTLQNGSYGQIALSNEYCIYERKNDKETIWTTINLKKEPVDIRFNQQAQGVDLITGKKVDLKGHLEMEPESVMILQVEQ